MMTLIVGVGAGMVIASAAQAPRPRPLILAGAVIDDSRRVVLAGNTRPEARTAAGTGQDAGPVEDALPLAMFLQLRRAPEVEAAARAFVASQSNPASPNYRHWISAAEYGSRFGAAPEDIAVISQWLAEQGFTVTRVPANHLVIEFSGNAGVVRSAFHADVHYLNIAGQRYYANLNDPEIPAALAPAITGVVSLNNFHPHTNLVPKAQYTVSPGVQAVVPGDLATIYNLNPAFAAGFTGAGETVVVVEDTDLYSGSGDWNTFRQEFGLAQQFPSGTLTQVHPAAGDGGACQDPGINGDDGEAALDVEWASAAAPAAAIVMASCADTTNFGGFIALQNLLTNGGPVPGIVSISYGEAEDYLGAAENAYIETLYQTAAAAGVSVFVSSGDNAAAQADGRETEVAVHGVNVSGFASTAYNVAVGGTDFGDVAAGTTSTYWSPVNGQYFASANSYVPEIPWNYSCGSEVAAHYSGFSTSYGSSGYCNSTYNWLDIIGASGGPSGCTTGQAEIGGVVGGTCKGWAKPTWQVVAGNPADGVRDLPDVSLFSSNGVWGHYLVFCITDGGSCSGAPSTWPGGGGTSFASPIMAGIQALINQSLGTTNAGNPDPAYYQIAGAAYATTASEAGCDATAGSGAGCSFNDVTLGDIVVPCAGSYDCYVGSGGLGVLSTSATSYQPAFAATAGWDFATGLGSVNAYNLLQAYRSLAPAATAPAAPVLQAPANRSNGVLPGTELSWSASAGATSYDVYFGSSNPPPLVANTSGLNYTLGALTPATTYYWAIGARNAAGANESAAWSFLSSCVASVSPLSAGAPGTGATAVITVTAAGGCGWAAASNVSWISITAGSSGNGNGSVSYSVAADATVGSQRTGTITVAGETVTVTQSAFLLITTLAGGGLPATATAGGTISIPLGTGTAVDAAGNVYFTSPSLNAVFRADPSGLVTRIAGTGLPGNAGDDGPALAAQLNSPRGLAVDASGDVFVADTNNDRIREITAAGTMQSIAGGGFGGDGGLALAAQLNGPYGVAVDGAGNVYIADTYDQAIRKVTAATGIIATVAGNGTSGFAGDGGPAVAAELAYPFGVVLDAHGNIFIADTNNNRIRAVSAATGIITTVAGTGGEGATGDGGPAASATMSEPFGLAMDATGDIFIADAGDNRIREVNAAGVISTVAGSTFGFGGDGGPATSAALNNPGGVAVDGSGNLYILDTGNSRLRRATSTGNISTLVGGATGDGGPAIFGYLSGPAGVARDHAGNTYIADAGNNRVRKLAANGTITTLAGTGIPGFSGDGGPAAAAELYSPQGVAVDGSGNVFIADTDNARIREVAANGTIMTVAGRGCCGNGGDGGPATGAQFDAPNALAVDTVGNIFVADTQNQRIRKIAPAGTITTVAGTGAIGFSGDGGPAAAAAFNYPYGVAVDAAGNLFIADTLNARIREVAAATGVITTVAGTGVYGSSGDGGPATAAQISIPYGVAVDGSGNLYIADFSAGLIREVTAAGTMATLAGSNRLGFSGDGGLATVATLWQPWGVAADAAGTVAIGDSGNNAVRLVIPAGTTPVLSLASTHVGSLTQGQAATFSLTVANGLGAGTTGGTVSVSEFLPSGLTLQSAAGAGWSCAAGTCTRADELAGGGSYPPVTVTATVSGSAPGQLTNVASVNGGGALAAGRALDLAAISAAGAGSGAIPAPAIQLSASALNFGPQTVGVPGAALPLTLTNTGNAALTLAPPGVAGSAGDFGVSSACGATVAAGASCQIAVIFTPQAIGGRSGTLALTDNASGSPQTVALTGTGAGSAAVVTGGPLTFAAQFTRTTSAPQTVTVTNAGSAALTFTAIAASGDFGETNTCGASLAVGAQCAIAVAFTPQAATARAGTLTISDNAGASPQTVQLSGTGVDLSIAPTGGSPTSVSVSPGQTATYTLAFAGVNGASGTFALTCTGAPVETNCMVSPTSLVLSAAAQTVTVTVATTAASIAGPKPGAPPMPWLWLVAALTSLGMGLRRRRVLIPVAACVMLLLLGGCGGGGSAGTGGAGGSATPATPAGNYTLTITASSGAVNRTTLLTLVVN